MEGWREERWGRRGKFRVEGGISGISGRHQPNVLFVRVILPSFRVGGEERGVMGGGRGVGEERGRAG